MTYINSPTIGIGLGALMLLVVLIAARKFNNSLLFYSITALVILLGLLLGVVYIQPLQEIEYKDYYSNNIHDAIISSTQTNITYYEKIIRIENVCRIYNNIPLNKCIGFAIDDINGT